MWRHANMRLLRSVKEKEVVLKHISIRKKYKKYKAPRSEDFEPREFIDSVCMPGLKKLYKNVRANIFSIYRFWSVENYIGYKIMEFGVWSTRIYFSRGVWSTRCSKNCKCFFRMLQLSTNVVILCEEIFSLIYPRFMGYYLSFKKMYILLGWRGLLRE